MYTVYKHTAPNGKVYIGITSRANIKVRWGNGGNNYKRQKIFYNAIQKYGWENFEHEVIFSDLTCEQANQKEIELIAIYKSNQREYGYNVTNGGGGVAGFHHTDEMKKHISQALIGEKHPLYGKHHTEQTRRKIGCALSLLYSVSKHPWIGRNHSEEAIAKMSRPVYCIELNTLYIGAREAARELGLNQGNITKACQGKLRTTGGYHWRYDTAT